MASFSRILAVDLGASAVRIIEIGPDEKGRPAVLSLSEEEIPFDPAKSADFFAPYVQALTVAVGRLTSKTSQCHLCLGGPAVFARILKVPFSDPVKTASMVGFEAQQTVPAIEQASWDFQLLPSQQSGEVEALVLAIKKETVEEMSAAVASTGLKPQSVTLAPAALCNSFIFNYPEITGCSLILDIGARATTILLVESQRLFARVVPIGGGAVTQAVATDLQESYAGAEILKKGKGFVHPGGAYEDPADAAVARISKLARGVMTRIHAEIERSVTFFRSQQGGGKPSQAYLSGGGALLGYTDIFFREKLRIPVEYFQPFRRLIPPTGAGIQEVYRKFPSWGTAVGTALQALPNPPVRVNLQSSSGRDQAQSARNRPSMVAVGLASAGLLLLPGIHFFWKAEKVRNLADPKVAEVQEAEQALAQVEAESKKLNTILGNWDQALTFVEERLRWLNLWHELRLRSQEKMWITALEKIKSNPGIGGATATKPGIETVATVEIRGMFETASAESDAQAVERFKDALNAGGVLRNVQVLEREAPEYVDGKTEQVALRFRLRAEWPISGADSTSPKKKS